MFKFELALLILNIVLNIISITITFNIILFADINVLKFTIILILLILLLFNNIISFKNMLV